MIDIKKGNSLLYGVIAQDVYKIFPESVKINPNSIPSIYKYADNIMIDGNNIIILIDIHDITILKKGIDIYLTIDSIDIKVTLIDFTYNSLTVSRWENFDINKQVLVYGTLIDDFHTIDKDYLSVVCMGGVQELSKINNNIMDQVSTLKKINITQKAEILTYNINLLQEKVNTMKKQISSLLNNN